MRNLPRSHPKISRPVRPRPMSPLRCTTGHGLGEEWRASSRRARPLQREPKRAGLSFFVPIPKLYRRIHPSIQRKKPKAPKSKCLKNSKHQEDSAPLRNPKHQEHHPPLRTRNHREKPPSFVINDEIEHRRPLKVLWRKEKVPSIDVSSQR